MSGLDMSLDDYASRGKKKRSHDDSDSRQGEGGWQGRRQGGGGRYNGSRGHSGSGGYSGGGGGGGGSGHNRHGGGGNNRDGGGGGGWKRPRYEYGTAGGSGPTPAGAKLDSEGHLWYDESNQVCTYFQDRRRKWPFYTGERGKVHLSALVAANAALREQNARLLEVAGEPGSVAAEGERLYVEKPTLRGDQNVTWSYDEYGHPGLQLYYLKLKSWQRFTETFALLERAGRRGLFDTPLPDGRPLRVAALGGGPGYELFAAQRYFREVRGINDVELINTDVQPTWREYSEALGFKFHTFDIFDGNLHGACGVDEIDYVIISYVLIYVAKLPGHPKHEAVCDELKRLLDGGVRAILVSERSEETAACGMMEARGVPVERLIDQSLGRDERQSLFLSADAAALITPAPPRAADADLTFANVPFEEHKIKRGGAAGAGGSQTKWYS